MGSPRHIGSEPKERMLLFELPGVLSLQGRLGFGFGVGLPTFTSVCSFLCHLCFSCGPCSCQRLRYRPPLLELWLSEVSDAQLEDLQEVLHRMFRRHVVNQGAVLIPIFALAAWKPLRKNVWQEVAGVAVDGLRQVGENLGQPPQVCIDYLLWRGDGVGHVEDSAPGDDRRRAFAQVGALDHNPRRRRQGQSLA